MKSSVIVAIVIVLAGNLYAASMHLAMPEGRSYACMIHDVANNRIVLFGGGNYRMRDGRVFNDTWTFDPNNEAWDKVSTSGTTPTERIMAAAAYDQTGHRMIIFGGGGELGPRYNDAWALDLTVGAEAWSLLSTSGTPPSPRTSATAVVDELNNRLIVFGGEAGAGGMNTTYSLSLNTLTWSQLFPWGTAPCPRFEHSAIYDPNGQRMIVFGGKNGVHLNDVWQLDLSVGSESWQQLYPGGSQPDARGRHFSVFDQINNDMIIGFGYGYPGDYVLYCDVWKMDLGALSWQQILYGGCTLPGRRGSCAAYRAIAHEVLIFGGDQPYASYFGETCRLNLDSHFVEENTED
jgi:hypothetical protein